MCVIHRFVHILFVSNGTVIFAETTEIPAGALDLLSEEAEPLGLRVSWIKTKVRASGDILDATVESIPVNGENVEVKQTFTYLGSVIHSSTSCEQEVNRRLRRAWCVALPILVQKDEGPSLSLVGPSGHAIFL